LLFNIGYLLALQKFYDNFYCITFWKKFWNISILFQNGAGREKTIIDRDKNSAMIRGVTDPKFPVKIEMEV